MAHVVQYEGSEVTPRARTELSAWRSAAPILIPVILTPANGDGDPIVATAIYVPERTELIRFEDLSPAEQAAVRSVLGPDERARSQPAI
jgi:hypothetical protein